MPWHIPFNMDRPTEPLGPYRVQAIHSAMTILEDIGIAFLNEEALDLFRAACCIVNGTNVRMGRDWVLDMLSRAPVQFTITPRNADRTIPIGGDHILFANLGSPPNYCDLDMIAKVSDPRAQYADVLRLTQYSNCIHFVSGYPVEAQDIHASIPTLLDMLRLTEKVELACSLGPERVEDAMEMVRISGGPTEEAFQAIPAMFANINSLSPLKHDMPMIDGCLRLIQRRVVVVTPVTLAWVMAPVTMAPSHPNGAMSRRRRWQAASGRRNARTASSMT